MASELQFHSVEPLEPGFNASLFVQQHAETLLERGWVTKKGLQSLQESLLGGSSEYLDRVLQYQQALDDLEHETLHERDIKENAPQPGLFLRIRDQIESTVLFKDLIERGASVHPNTLTAVRLPLAAVVLLAYHLDPRLAAVLFSANALFDWADGALARSTGKFTEDGKRFDPLMDKVIIMGTALYIAGVTQDSLVMVAAALTTLIDGMNQLQRGALSEQVREFVGTLLGPGIYTPPSEDRSKNANVFGKVKAIIQTGAIIGLLSGELVASSIALMVASPLALLGMLKRMQTSR